MVPAAGWTGENWNDHAARSNRRDHLHSADRDHCGRRELRGHRCRGRGGFRLLRPGRPCPGYGYRTCTPGATNWSRSGRTATAKAERHSFDSGAPGGVELGFDGRRSRRSAAISTTCEPPAPAPREFRSPVRSAHDRKYTPAHPVRGRDISRGRGGPHADQHRLTRSREPTRIQRWYEDDHYFSPR